MTDVRCSRCGSVAAGLETAPLPGEAGTLVLKQTCAACWGEWVKVQVMLMNEYRWTPANPEHFSALIGHMKAYLDLSEEGTAPPAKSAGSVTGVGKPAGPVKAVTFDFYNTLAFHAAGPGRGPSLMHYLERQALECDPWEHQVLYDVFERHDRDYDPKSSPADGRRYRVDFTRRLFRRLGVKVSGVSAASHAEAVWRLLGPGAFAVFSDVEPTLDALRDSGYPVAVVSNWQRGLRHFCDELGLAGRFEFVLSSAEVGAAKPDSRIFAAAARRLNLSPAEVLHVGDSPAEDQQGAWDAGGRALLVRRESASENPTVAREPSVFSLAQLPALLATGASVGAEPRG